MTSGIKIDTLNVSLFLSDTNDTALNNSLTARFDSIISIFNRTENSFYIKKDSSKVNYFISFTMGPIKYVDAKKNIWVTGMDLALIGANILILPFPPIIPFYLMPATYSVVQLNYTPNLFKKPGKLFVNPNGYFTGREKQKMRVIKKFNNVFSRFFIDIAKQQKKS